MRKDGFRRLTVCIHTKRGTLRRTEIYFEGYYDECGTQRVTAACGKSTPIRAEKRRTKGGVTFYIIIFSTQFRQKSH